MADVTFFFDPACPWTWRASRWLTLVAETRGLVVAWRPMSLWVLNGRDVPDDSKRATLEMSYRWLRVAAKYQPRTLIGVEGTGGPGIRTANGAITTGMGMHRADLADFLRRSRERLTPGYVGLAEGPRRRGAVPAWGALTARVFRRGPMAGRSGPRPSL